MNPEPELYVRVDASTTMGIGHFMRCFALAEYWRESSRKVTFVGQYPDALAGRLARLDITSVPLEAVHPDKNDLARTLETIPDRSIVVLDGYQFDEAYKRALADRYRLLVIDDSDSATPDSHYLLLNQNLDAQSADALGGDALGADLQGTDVQTAAPRLLGPEFALLRSEFRRRAGNLRIHPERVTRILLNMGGGDEHNVTAQILDVLLDLGLPDVEIRILAGPANPNLDVLRKRAAAAESAVLVEDTPDVAAEMEWAELAITGAGTTCWELSVMGLPGILVVMAENQAASAVAMHRAGAAIHCGSAEDLDVNALRAIIAKLVASRETREAISKAAAILVDGDGVVRATHALLEIE